MVIISYCSTVVHKGTNVSNALSDRKNISHHSTITAISIFFSFQNGLSPFACNNPSTGNDCDNSIKHSKPFCICYNVFVSYYQQKKYWKTYAVHDRYMIGTSLLMIGPGLGRSLIIYAYIPFPFAVSYTDGAVIAIAIILLLYDVVKKRNYTHTSSFWLYYC